MSLRRQILKLKLAAMLGLNASFDADCDGLLCSSAPAERHVPALAASSGASSEGE
jgi:hypothetical protein